MENNKVITVVAMIMVILFSGLSFGVFDQAFAQVKDPSFDFGNAITVNVVPDHIEVGDAGNLPATAQDPGGVGPLTSISGSGGGVDEDMYRICITNPSAFSATTLSMADFDTQLFLFDSTGRGVYSNDDFPGGPPFHSFLPPGDVNSPTAVGIHFIAISGFNDEAENAAGLIFADAAFTDVNGPTGPGGANPITSWTGPGSGPGAYAIVLTAAAATSSCDAVGGTMIPLDTTALLLAGAQMNAAWMIPVIVLAIGIGIVIARKL